MITATKPRVPPGREGTFAGEAFTQNKYLLRCLLGLAAADHCNLYEEPRVQRVCTDVWSQTMGNTLRVIGAERATLFLSHDELLDRRDCVSPPSTLNLDSSNTTFVTVSNTRINNGSEPTSY
jgi:hypothetical protein